MNYQKYKFKQYDKTYPLLFQREKAKLKKILTKSARIEHVGSTAVPGLGGKGIIDILVFVPNRDLSKNFKILKENRFEYSPHPGDDKRKFFQKRIIYRGKERRVHIHLTADKGFCDSFIAFREYLRKNPKIRDEYARIKMEGAKLAEEDKMKYANHKLNFLKETVRKALEEK